ncbi:hypothetical protein B9Z55_017811 [Caenorhabditis nigoni]|nr:hypothetical protein B9Z55_017811 [Caenorhabditis nigoni]
MPDAYKTTSDAVTATNSVLSASAKFATKKVAENLLKYCALGVVVKDLIPFLKPDQPSAEMKKLKELESKLNALSTRMEQGFNGIKTFVAAHNFYNKFASKAATLMSYMRQTMSNPSHHTKGLFQRAVVDNPPLWYAKQLIEQLSIYETNPLKVAMNELYFPQYETFSKWKEVINEVLAQFLIVETYLNGMFWDANMIGPNELRDKLKELSEKMDEWFKEYHRVNNTSWTGIEKYIHHIQDSCQHIGNEGKCDRIVKEFDDMMTNRAFTVLVYNDCGGYDNHAFYGHNALFSFRRGGCNIAVFRVTWEHGACASLDDLLYDETIPT